MKACLLLTLLIFTSASFAAQIVMSSRDGYISIARANTKLPFNLLLADYVCYEGKQEEITKIVEAMLKNLRPSKLVKVERHEYMRAGNQIEVELEYTILDWRSLEDKIRMVECNI